MPDYLTKEEIRQWRSSLEKITLEDYAKKLGKVISEEKETNDMIDKVMTHSLNSMQTSEYQAPSERLQTITLKTMFEHKEQPKTKEEVSVALDCADITFKKPLIPREQMIFDYLLKNKGVIVYAKDMAALLELPRDYVYKYIKNLRQKLNQDVLFNADNGGYVLKV